MAEIVGQHQQSTFTAPSPGDSEDANVVKSNDNALKATLNAHDADPGIHVQSGTFAARPAAGSLGRKYLASDTLRLYYDTGATWSEINYIVAGGDATMGVNGRVFSALTSTYLGFGAATVESLRLSASALYPIADNTIDLGLVSTNRFRDLFIQRITMAAGGTATTGALVGDATNGLILTGLTGATNDFQLRDHGGVARFSMLSTGALLFGGGVTISTGGLSVQAGGITVSSGLCVLVASAAGTASLRIPHGVAPTTPSNGDTWTTTAGLFVQVNGVTVGPLAVATNLGVSFAHGSTNGTGVTPVVSTWTDLNAAGTVSSLNVTVSSATLAPSGTAADFAFNCRVVVTAGTPATWGLRIIDSASRVWSEHWFNGSNVNPMHITSIMRSMGSGGTANWKVQVQSSTASITFAMGDFMARSFV